MWFESNVKRQTTQKVEEMGDDKARGTRLKGKVAERKRMVSIQKDKRKKKKEDGTRLTLLYEHSEAESVTYTLWSSSRSIVWILRLSEFDH